MFFSFRVVLWLWVIVQGENAPWGKRSGGKPGYWRFRELRNCDGGLCDAIFGAKGIEAGAAESRDIMMDGRCRKFCASCHSFPVAISHFVREALAEGRGMQGGVAPFRVRVRAPPGSDRGGISL